MTNGEQLDRFLRQHCSRHTATRWRDRGSLKHWPRVQVQAICSWSGTAQGWSVIVNNGVNKWIEIAYFRSWTVAVALAFDTADYIRSREAA